MLRMPLEFLNTPDYATKSPDKLQDCAYPLGLSEEPNVGSETVCPL